MGLRVGPAGRWSTPREGGDRCNGNGSIGHAPIAGGFAHLHRAGGHDAFGHGTVDTCEHTGSGGGDGGYGGMHGNATMASPVAAAPHPAQTALPAAMMPSTAAVVAAVVPAAPTSVWAR